MKLKWLSLLAVFGSFACSFAPKHIAENIRKALPDRKPAYAVTTQEGVDPADLSFAELQKALSENRFSKISELLAYVQLKYPMYMSHYALAFNSKSLHGSSRQAPRAIVYGKTGKFVISFNGLPEQQAYNELEVMEFNQTTNTFEFREIEFREGGQSPQFTTISSVNGPDNKCLVCHSAQRPIWEAYDSWPGMYGGDDDYPMSHNKYNPAGVNLPSQSLLNVNLPASVKQNWLDFEAHAKNSGRYQYLNPMAESLYIPGMGPRPNADLGLLLQHQNMKRIGQLLKNAGAAQSPLRVALLYAANDCISGDLIRGTTNPREFAVGKRIFNAYRDSIPIKIQNLITYQTGKLAELISDQGLEPQAVKGQWGLKIASNNPVDFVALKITPPNSLFGTIAGISDGTLGVVGITQKYFPQAQAEKWPINLYEDVHIYETGEATNSVFATTIENFLFSPQERAAIRTFASSHNSEEVCHSLLAKVSGI